MFWDKTADPQNYLQHMIGDRLGDNFWEKIKSGDISAIHEFTSFFFCQ